MMTTKVVTKSAEVLKADIADTQPQIKCAGDQPHKHNKEFQMIATAQRETQKLDLVLPLSNSYVPCCVGNLRQGIDGVI